MSGSFREQTWETLVDIAEGFARRVTAARGDAPAVIAVGADGVASWFHRNLAELVFRLAAGLQQDARPRARDRHRRRSAVVRPAS